MRSFGFFDAQDERGVLSVAPEGAPLSFQDSHPWFENIMRKPDHIFDLERRQQVLEEEIARALLHCSPDDPMVADIKRRMLHLKEELERFCNKAIADRRLH